MGQTAWIPPMIAAWSDMDRDQKLQYAQSYQNLLDTSTVSVDQLNEIGVDPTTPGLIYLVDRNGVKQFPTFQLDKENEIRSVVIQINLTMEASPSDLATNMAIWQWWDDEHLRLPKTGDRRPCAQLGVMSDQDLFDLAREDNESDSY